MKLLTDTIVGYLKNMDCKFSSTEEECAASAFLFINDQENAREDLRNKWMNIIIPNTDLTINKLSEYQQFKLYLLSHSPDSEKTAPKEPEIWTVPAEQKSMPQFDLLIRNWYDKNGYLRQLFVNDKNCSILHFADVENPPFDDEYLKNNLLEVAKLSWGVIGGRLSIPAWGKYIKLAVNVGQLKWCRSISQYHFCYMHFISPFFFKYKQKKVVTDGLEELCIWVEKHSLKKIEIAEARELYHEFIKWIDDEIMADSIDWKELRKT